MTDCVFCQKIANHDVDQFHPYTNVVRFTLLNPVVPGHQLFVPTLHVADAASDSEVTGLTFEQAALWAAVQGKPFNLITSGGAPATQSVFHLHVHYVPRAEGDGLHLPWTGQQPAGSSAPSTSPMNPNGPYRCPATDGPFRCFEMSDRHPRSGRGLKPLHSAWGLANDGSEYLHAWETAEVPRG